MMPAPRRGAVPHVLAGLLLVLLLAGGAGPAAAASLDGVTMPDVLQYRGIALKLNGMGMRTYSVFRVHIYIAGLYLEHPTGDPEAILNSPQVKLLRIRFMHDVDVERARDAWVEGFADNCKPPCHLPPDQVQRFLAEVPAFHRGDDTTLLFDGDSVNIELNGRTLGVVRDALFTRIILATFIGAYPPTEPLKHGLLGLPN